MTRVAYAKLYLKSFSSHVSSCVSGGQSVERPAITFLVGKLTIPLVRTKTLTVKAALFSPKLLVGIKFHLS